LPCSKTEIYRSYSRSCCSTVIFATEPLHAPPPPSRFHNPKYPNCNANVGLVIRHATSMGKYHENNDSITILNRPPTLRKYTTCRRQNAGLRRRTSRARCSHAIPPSSRRPTSLSPVRTRFNAEVRETKGRHGHSVCSRLIFPILSLSLLFSLRQAWWGLRYLGVRRIALQPRLVASRAS
jgi:hypothetical protein